MKSIAEDPGNAVFEGQSVLWRNMYYPGHEACWLESRESQWHFNGTAIFAYEAKPCQLNYHIVCDPDWRTLSAEVEGWVGEKVISLQLEVDDQCTWWLNRVEMPSVAGCIDLDLNFSPSTNTVAIRRLKLEIGEQKEITAAWLRFPGFTLEPVPQVYHRLEEDLFRYQSNGGRYVADLRVTRQGLVVDYPKAWIAESFNSK